MYRNAEFWNQGAGLPLFLLDCELFSVKVKKIDYFSYNMDMTIYIPFAILGAFTLVVLLILHRIEKKEREESQNELQEYLHRWQIESDKNDKNAQRILDEIQQTQKKIDKTNNDNSIFLRMIFERVDRPHPE